MTSPPPIGSRRSGFDPQATAQRQLDAYNAHDLEAFLREYTDDVVVQRLSAGAPMLVGKPAMAAHYARHRFNRPDLRADLLHRTVLGNKVLDHERIVGLGDAPVHVVAIYEVTPEGISRVWFVDPG